MRGYGGKERGREGGSEECTLILPPYPFCKGVATETNIAAVMAAIYSGGEKGMASRTSLHFKLVLNTDAMFSCLHVC